MRSRVLLSFHVCLASLLVYSSYCYAPDNATLGSYVPLRISKLLSVPLIQELNFKTPNGVFNLTLIPDRSLFTIDTNIVVIGVNGSAKEMDASRFSHWIFRGKVNGDVRSELSATLRDGLFDGRFAFNGTEYRLEPYARYFGPKTPTRYNAILFESTDLDPDHDLMSLIFSIHQRRRVKRLRRRSHSEPTDLARNPPNSADLQRSFPSGPDPFRSNQTRSGHVRHIPNEADLLRKLPSSLGLYQTVPVSAESFRTTPTGKPTISIDRNRNTPNKPDHFRSVPDGTGTSRNQPNNADFQRSLPSSPDPSRSNQTRSGHFRPIPNKADLLRKLPSSLDLYQTVPVSAESFQTTPTGKRTISINSVDRNRNTPSKPDHLRSVPDGTGTSRNHPNNAGLNRSVRKSADSARKVPKGADLRRQQPSGADLQRRHPSVAGNATDDGETSLVCDLKIVTDFRFFANFGYQKFELANYVSQLLGPVDVAFRRLDADGDGQPDNIGFYVTELRIFSAPVHPDWAQRDPPWNASAFFREMALYDFSGACAGLLFTDRQMAYNDASTGLSLLRANPSKMEQGICSVNHLKVPRPEAPPQDDYGDYFSNARVVNFRSIDRTVFNRPAVQTLHQLAHLFGATDDTEACTGSTDDDQNRYLTSFPPPTGYELKNWRFSECAANAIGRFLRHNGRSCLKFCNVSQCDYPMDRAYVGLLEHRKNDPTRRRFTEHCATIPRSLATSVIPGLTCVFVFAARIPLRLVTVL